MNGALLCFYFRLKCTPERCQICQDSFGEGDIAAIDCVDACDQCKLCVGAALEMIPECALLCSKGLAVCRSTCYKGKAICSACALKMGCMGYGLYYSIGK